MAAQPCVNKNCGHEQFEHTPSRRYPDMTLCRRWVAMGEMCGCPEFIPWSDPRQGAEWWTSECVNAKHESCGDCDCPCHDKADE